MTDNSKFVSAEEAVKALEELAAPDAIPHALRDIWEEGVGAAIGEIERLRSLPAVPQKEIPSEIHSHIQTLRTVIEENAQTYTPEGMVIFLKSLLREFEFLLSSPAVPHVHTFGAWRQANAPGWERARRFCSCGEYEFRDSPAVPQLEPRLTRKQLEEISHRIDLTTERPIDDKRTAAQNWWAGVYSLIDALATAPLPQPETRECPTNHEDANGDSWAELRIWDRALDFCPDCGQPLPAQPEREGE